MSCEDTRKLLHAYSDGELDLAHSLEVETHVQDCGRCAQELAFNSSLRAALASEDLYRRAPRKLDRQIRSSVRQEADLRPAAGEGFRPWRSLGFALVGALAVLVIWAAVARIGRPSENVLAQEIVSGHVRSLMGTHLMDVVSTDQHTVKPWFDGKLDFSPPVTDFAAQGFPLLGGRLDYIQNRSAAALVYGRRKHVINLFAWPAAPGREVAAQDSAQQGYNTICWSHAAMNFCAVSDVSAADLLQFAALAGK